MRLPTFEVNDMRLVKRVTLIADKGKVISIHYPVFPSDSDASWVINQLS
jgi:peroxiredoxin